VSSYILDLRDNPGGLVRAGIDVARLFLGGRPTIFHVTSRDEQLAQTVALEEEGEKEGGARGGETSAPLVRAPRLHGGGGGGTRAEQQRAARPPARGAGPARHGTTLAGGSGWRLRRLHGPATPPAASGAAPRRAQLVSAARLPPRPPHPQVVLVNAGSASAAEILSGALHDNQRAAIVGDSHTYGKGRIQSVYELQVRGLGKVPPPAAAPPQACTHRSRELGSARPGPGTHPPPPPPPLHTQDGSALFVTVAKYRTPSGLDIDHKGIQPDASCAAPAPPLAARAPGAPAEVAGGQYLAGLPYEEGSGAALALQLAGDRCVIMAERLLLEQQQQQQMAASRA
jgi:hypothetical protein